MEAKLIPTVGMDGVDEISLLPEQPVTVGRAETAEVRLMQSKVSRCPLPHHLRGRLLLH